MDKELLHRFFDGRTTFEEELRIRRWLETSEAHRKILFHERKLFDALLLHADLERMNAVGRRSARWKNTARWVAGAAAIVLLALSVGFYVMNRPTPDEATNSIFVPQGQCVRLTLSDGTGVWLNSKTSMTYPQDFRSSGRRMVHIDGEAYFEVTPDSNRPFVVMTRRGKVEVLGTKFYVSAYGNGDFETSLMEGSVKVSAPEAQLILKPHHKAVLTGDGRLMSKRISDMDAYRWKEGLYCFRNLPLAEVLKQFERYYDVRFILCKNLESHNTLSGKFRLVDGVEYALRVLQRDIDFTFRRSEEAEIIYIE